MMRHFLTMTDLTPAELRALLQQAAGCKRRRTAGRGILRGRVVALVFQKPSVRTRVSFEVAIRQLGGSSIYLGPEDAQVGTREPVKDAARTLSRYVDGIIVRTVRHSHVEEWARYASVPVINGLSDLHHPCQALADLLTMQEHWGRLKGLRVCYIGDGNNVLHSLVQGGAMLGLRLVAATPNRYKPDPVIWTSAVRLAKASGGSVRWEPDPRRAARGAEVLYTDVWVSMGQESERVRRRRVFRDYRIDRTLLRVAARRCRVMHCLPAHRGEEITEDVMEGKRSLIFEQAENRLHTQKALLVWLLRRRED